MNNYKSEQLGFMDLDEVQLEQIEGGSFIALAIGCLILAGMCYYCGDHSAR